MKLEKNRTLHTTPGLYSEIEPQLEELNFNQTRHLSKWQFKRLVKKFMRRKNRDDLLNWIRSYKKSAMKSAAKKISKEKTTFINLTHRT